MAVNSEWTSNHCSTKVVKLLEGRMRTIRIHPSMSQYIHSSNHQMSDYMHNTTKQ